LSTEQTFDTMSRMMSADATEKVADGLTALAGIDLDVLCDEALNRLVARAAGFVPSVRCAGRRSP
jgi:hypothetical protein